MRITALLFVLFISVKSYTQVAVEVDSAVFTKVDKDAFYPGGEKGWRDFLVKNLNGNTPTDHGAPGGQYTVMIQFIVNANGNLSDMKALTKEGYGMEEEVLRIIRKSGKWEPAMINNRPVKAYRKQPVTFVVMNDFDVHTKIANTLFTDTDNELTIEVEKVKDEDLKLTISEGTITSAGNGKYIIRVTKPGKVLLRVFDAKKNKELGAESFMVKTAGEAPVK